MGNGSTEQSYYTRREVGQKQFTDFSKLFRALSCKMNGFFSCMWARQNCLGKNRQRSLFINMYFINLNIQQKQENDHCSPNLNRMNASFQ